MGCSARAITSSPPWSSTTRCCARWHSRLDDHSVHRVTYVGCDQFGVVDPDAVRAAMRAAHPAGGRESRLERHRRDAAGCAKSAASLTKPGRSAAVRRGANAGPSAARHAPRSASTCWRARATRVCSARWAPACWRWARALATQLAKRPPGRHRHPQRTARQPTNCRANTNRAISTCRASWDWAPASSICRARAQTTSNSTAQSLIEQIAGGLCRDRRACASAARRTADCTRAPGQHRGRGL